MNCSKCQKPLLCERDGTPLVERIGKYGQFYSCPVKKEDGAWCGYIHRDPKTVSGGTPAPKLAASGTIKAKVISYDHTEEFQEKINEALSAIVGEIVDVKFATSGIFLIACIFYRAKE